MKCPDANALALSIDPYSREFLIDPYDAHEQLREAAPLVWLEKYGCWALARYGEVHATLLDWNTFCSGAGVGLSDFRLEKPWRPPSLLLEADPPLHTRTRGVITTVLSRRALNSLRQIFAAEADALIDRLIERGSFDAIKELAEAYPLKVFPDAVGVGEDGRENLLRYGDMVFNAFGPRNELFEDSVRRAETVTTWIGAHCRREALAPGGFGAAIYAAADAGAVSEEEAGLLVRSLLTAGVDTTVNAIGNALVCLTRHPQEWSKLHAHPELARSAFEEAIRYESPVQTFFRTTTREVVIAGVRLSESAKILMLLGSANRDPRRWREPRRFDIERNASNHVGFGAGAHACVGQMIARLEGEIVLTSLAQRVASIEATGAAVPRLNNTLRGWSGLPVTVKGT